MRITWPGRILLLAIVVSITYAWMNGREVNQRVAELSELPSCELALSYFEWRVQFESGLAAGQTTIEGAELREFTRSSRTYRDAIRTSQRTDDPVLSSLHAMARVDADPDVEQVADFEGAATAFSLGCPSQVGRLTERF